MNFSRRSVIWLCLAGLVGAVICACTPSPESARAAKTPSPATLNLAQMVAKVTGGRVISVQDTGSMEPALDGRMAVVILQAVTYSPGDIVVFKHEDGLIIHRVREVDARGRLWTKGDHNTRRDGFWVEPADVQGRVIATISL